MLRTLTPRSTVNFGATINSLATETHVSFLNRIFRIIRICPMVQQHKNPPLQCHARILGLTINTVTRNQHSVLFGRSCEALSPPRDLHRHYQQTPRKSDVSMQITQLCHPPCVTNGARCKSTTILNAKTQASVHIWDRPTMMYFATCGVEYRTAQVLDTPDLVL